MAPLSLKILNGEGITGFSKDICDGLSRRNLSSITIISPWITPRKKSEYSLSRILDALELSHRRKELVMVEVFTRPPILGDFKSGGERHAQALFQLLSYPNTRVNIVRNLHTKMYSLFYSDDYMGGSQIFFGSANMTWQAESNTNHETMVIIPGSHERLSKAMFYSASGITELIEMRITSRMMIQRGIEDSVSLSEYINDSIS